MEPCNKLPIVKILFLSASRLACLSLCNLVIISVGGGLQLSREGAGQAVPSAISTDTSSHNQFDDMSEDIGQMG